MAGSNGSTVEAAAANKTSTPTKENTNETLNENCRLADDKFCYQDDEAAGKINAGGEQRRQQETERQDQSPVESVRPDSLPPPPSSPGLEENAPDTKTSKQQPDEASQEAAKKASSVELNQISINGTTFYHVNPAVLRSLPATNGHLNGHYMGHYNYTGAYSNSPPPNLMPYIQHYPPPQQQQQPLLLLAAAAPVYLTPDHYYWSARQPPPPPPPLFYTLPYELIHSSHYGPLPPPMPPVTSYPAATQIAPIDSPLQTSPASTTTTDVSQLKLGYNLIPLLPINAIPTRIRQAYGMDEVWQDEFEQLFSQFVSQVVWTLVEVETNPSIRSSNRILAYKSRYIVRVDGPAPVGSADGSGSIASISAQDGTESEVEHTSGDDEFDESSWNDEVDEEHNCCSTGSNSVSDPAHGQRKFPLKFRMFIDSAKVRFCCDSCGHGWTSMKGRVVFWYEVFELVDGPDRKNAECVSNLIGYCAYKLFGQQCDICKIENRFERPMWYPEEVTKVLCNLFNKIGQVYFGLRMPTIDKQRRAGKPKTSHNSLLCQACYDGVCTNRK